MKTTLNSSVSASKTALSSKPSQVNPQAKASSFSQRLGGIWSNLSLQVKLALLVAMATAIPVFIVTQQLNKLSTDSFFANLKESLDSEATVLNEEYVLRTNKTAKVEAEDIALAVQGYGIDLSQPKEQATRRDQLQQLLRLRSDAPSNEVMSFKIITDTEGTTIAQNAQILNGDLTSNPLLPSKDGTIAQQQYRTVSLSSGISLGDVPIVKNVLQTQRPLSGIELLKAEPLQRLGLGQQIGIGLRPQLIKGLPEPKQPFPAGTYDIDGGKAGFVSMSVYPIKVNGRLVGTVVVGSLLNRNNALVDNFVQRYAPESVATIFAKDLRVATNVPYINPDTKARDNTRATSTLLSREVAEVMLNQGQVFKGETNIAGLDYQTVYLPLYDHQKELNPQAKPIGMTLVAKPLAKVNEELRNQQLFGYGIGGGILLLATLVAIPIAGTLSRPLRKLSDSARRIKEGEQGVKIEVTEQRNEIGQLSSSLSSLLDQLTINEDLRRQEMITTERLQQASEAQQESEVLQADVGHILDVVSAVEDGDLTVQAEVSDRATGLVADTLNRLIAELAKTMGVVLATSQQIDRSADDLKQLAASAAQQVELQTQSVVQAQALMSNVNEISQDTAEQALQSNAAIQAAQAAVSQGQQEIAAMNKGVVSLQEGAEQIVKRAQSLAEFVSSAAQFTNDQKRVASLTRVLALNASMIAARASAQQDPEQFASVAKEFETIANQVNELAVQTNQSLVLLQQRTDRIQTVVSGVDDDVQEITGLMEDFTQGVERSRQVLNNIQAVTEQVAQTGAQVTQSSQAIAEAARNTLGKIDDIASVATQTEQQSRFTRDRAEGMDRLARVLLETVQFFRLPSNLQEDETVAKALSFTSEDDTEPDLVKIS